MLEFTEALKKELKQLRRDAETHIVSGRVQTMEQYRQILGRIEGYNFVDSALDALLQKTSED